jgi:hypothetical protein
MKGTLNTFYYLIASQIILLLLVVMYAGYMVQLNCPQYDALQEQWSSVPYNETSAITALQNTWTVLSLLFSGCSGIPWWIYMVIFVPALIAIVVYVVPFVGGG